MDFTEKCFKSRDDPMTKDFVKKVLYTYALSLHIPVIGLYEWI